MAEIGLRTRMLVKDIMSSPVVTVPENTPIDKTAQLMSDGRLDMTSLTSILVLNPISAMIHQPQYDMI